MWQRIKVTGVAILALFVLIVVLQNTEIVDTRVLFVTVSMPRAALLFGALVVGFIIGIFAAGKLFAPNNRRK